MQWIGWRIVQLYRYGTKGKRIYLGRNMHSQHQHHVSTSDIQQATVMLTLPPTRPHVKNVNLPLIPPTQTPPSPSRCQTSTPTTPPHRPVPTNAAIPPTVMLLDHLDDILFMFELTDVVVVRKVFDERLDVATDGVGLCVL